MSSEHSQDSDIPVHRPLPRVDIPLLADERRQRIRYVWLGPLIAVVGGIAIAGGWLVSDWLRASRSEPGDASALASAEQAAHGAAALKHGQLPPGASAGVDGLSHLGSDDASENRQVVRFGRAKGFENALLEAGVGANDAVALIKGLEGVLDFRRCRPDDQLVLERTSDGQLQGFEYHISPVKIFRAERAGDGSFKAKQKEVKVETVRIARGGKVKTSLGDALDAAGLGRALVGVFVQVFDSRMSFTTDTREGDGFRIIVDEERLKGEFLGYGTVHALEYRSQKKGTLRSYWFEARSGAPEFFDETGRAIQGGWLRAPLQYEYISSGFSLTRMHPVVKRRMPHLGIDFVAASGVPVWAAADGRVTFVGEKGPNGNLVVIQHGNGYRSYYAHLLRFKSGLKRGDRVKQHDVVGYVGSTGRSTGPHLHFGLKRGGRFVDPLKVLNTPGPPLRGQQARRFRERSQALLRQLERIPI